MVNYSFVAYLQIPDELKKEEHLFLWVKHHIRKKVAFYKRF